jgi:hypothetical protein
VTGEPAVSDTAGSDTAGSDAPLAQRLRTFVAAHGGHGEAVVEYLGRVGARIVVVAADGAFCDAIASSVDAAARICSRAEIPLADGWTRELSATISPSPEDRRRMAGTGR